MNQTTTADALYTVGHWLIEQSRHDDAKHVFRTMLALAATDERGWLALGICHEETQELDKAAQLYALAPAACKSGARCLIALARVQRRLGDDDLADETYERAATLASDSDDDLVNIINAERTS
ncbi:MAG TPA: tetratricopeptide repeat protein [Labilithrix sp.]|nr:tetratricopeptide repeat protein [Labilithrix sp.]